MSNTLSPRTGQESSAQIASLYILIMIVFAWPSLLLGLLLYAVIRFLPIQVRWIGWTMLILLGGGGMWYVTRGSELNATAWMTALFVEILTWKPALLLGRFMPLWEMSSWIAPLQGLLFAFFLPSSAKTQLLSETNNSEKREEKRREEAMRSLENMPAEVSSEVPVGVALAGDLPWTSGPWFLCPKRHYGEPIFVVGESGSGKTKTVMRLAYGGARTHKRQIIYLDAKGDPKTAAEFVACMWQAGVDHNRIKVFPYSAYDGWRGNTQGLLNRLIAIQSFSDEYYQSVATTVLDLALRASPVPISESRTLLRRLDKDTLEAFYASRPEAKEVDEMTMTEIKGTRYRYRAFFNALGGKLDGTWAFEDVDAAYLLIPGLALRNEAASLGRFFIEELAHYIGERKQPDREVLVVMDELSALNMGTDVNPAGLFERIRSFGAGVVGTSQSREGLGLYADRVVESATLRIIHRSSDPENLVQRAGTKKEIDTGWQVQQDATTGLSTMRVKDTFNVHPDKVRRLKVGYAYFTAGGRGREVCVGAVPVSQQMLELATRFLEDEARQSHGTIP